MTAAQPSSWPTHSPLTELPQLGPSSAPGGSQAPPLSSHGPSGARAGETQDQPGKQLGLSNGNDDYVTLLVVVIVVL